MVPVAGGVQVVAMAFPSTRVPPAATVATCVQVRVSGGLAA